MNTITISIQGPANAGKTLLANQIAQLVASQGGEAQLDAVRVLPGVSAHTYNNTPSVQSHNTLPQFANTRVVIRERK